jgi:hypothetical protein
MGVGLTTQEYIHVNTVGLRFELLGKGMEMLINPLPDEVPVVKPVEKIYGINISPFGTYSQNVQVDGMSFNMLLNSINKVNGILVTFPGGSEAAFVNGLQVSFLANFCFVANGIQVAIGNVCEKKSTGIQIGGGNESVSHTGLQASLLFNEAKTTSAGLQISLFNFGEEFRGVQIGLFNYATNLKGLQIGLLNVNGKRILPFINW